MAWRFPAIEVRHLRYFIAASDQGSFRKAGALLGTTESSISRRMRELEHEVGASLFHRYSGGVHLTLAGQHFLRRARAILQSISDSARDIAAIARAGDGHIKVGIFTSLGSAFLTKLLRVYTRQQSGVSVDFIDYENADHITPIRRLELDIAFVTGTREWQGCETSLVGSERVFVALPNNHELVQKDALTWNDVANVPVLGRKANRDQDILNYILRRFAEPGHLLRYPIQLVDQADLMPIIASGRALYLTNEAVAAREFQGVTFRPLAGEMLPFSAVWSSQNDNPALEQMLSIVRILPRHSLELSDK